MSQFTAVVLGHVPGSEAAPAADLAAETAATASTERPDLNWAPVIVN